MRRCHVCGESSPPEARFCASCGTALDGAVPGDRALTEASRLIATGVGGDLDSTLDQLTEQARALLRADAATMHLTAPDGRGFLRRRANPLAPPESPAARVNDVFYPGALAQEAIAQRRPAFAADYQRDPRGSPDLRRHLPSVVATMAVPLLAGDELVGILHLDWTRPHTPAESELRLLDALANHAAVAIKNARLFEQAREAVRTRDEFLASVAHDLKTPLTAMKARIQLLQRWVERGDDDARQRLARGLAEVDQGIARMTGMIDELRDVAQLRLGQTLQLRPSRVDLVEIARRTTAESQQLARRHTVRLEADGPPLVGIWDEARLERVLANLLNNAVKYSPAGGEVVVATARRQADGRDWAVVEVRDRGVGIPAADLPHIFERFRRGSNVSNRIAGTGIGLAGARQIVEQHGGRIAVQSQEGHGSTFAVWLPLSPPAPAPPPSSPTSTTATAHPHPTSP